MGEISDLIGIYGGIDRAVAANAESRAEVARILPIYDDRDDDRDDERQVSWFDDFEAWTKERRAPEAEGDPFPSPGAALRDLAEIPARGRMVARRLFAIALTARAFPELLADDDERAALASALISVNGIENEDRAGRLLELLVDERLLRDDDETPRTADAWWESLLEVASAEGLLAHPGLIGPRPCTPRLVMVDMPDGTGPVATLETEFETDQIPFEKAIRFLDPVNWPQCNDFWCEMTKIGGQAPGPYHYHEVVSTDCPDKPAAWTIEAYLDFGFFNIPCQLAVAEYDLTKPHPLPTDDVVVDGGSLAVREIGSPAAPAINVKTTKRIKFNRPFDGPALALMMCALGYASVAEDLVFTCAALGDDQAGTAFPGAAAPAAAGPGPIGVVGEWEKLMKTCLDECVDAAQASSKKMAQGEYTADDLVKDAAAMWARAIREGAKGVDLAARGAQNVARGRVREP
jgi:hypothetical protein